MGVHLRSAGARGLLGFPEQVKPIAILCLGHVEQFYSAPMLVQERWREPRPLEELLYENDWANPCTGL